MAAHAFRSELLSVPGRLESKPRDLILDGRGLGRLLLGLLSHTYVMPVGHRPPLPEFGSAGRASSLGHAVASRLGQGLVEWVPAVTGQVQRTKPVQAPQIGPAVTVAGQRESSPHG